MRERERPLSLRRSHASGSGVAPPVSAGAGRVLATSRRCECCQAAAANANAGPSLRLVRAATERLVRLEVTRRNGVVGLTRRRRAPLVEVSQGRLEYRTPVVGLGRDVPFDDRVPEHQLKRDTRGRDVQFGALAAHVDV